MSKKRLLNILISLVVLVGLLPAQVSAQPPAAPTLLLASNLVYTGPASGDSQTTVTLSAILSDEFSAPLVGRAVYFSLGGLSPVSGISDGSGIASVDLGLALAPGNYTLFVAFNGDGEYDPVSIEAALEVTSPWGVWTQDNQADFDANTLTDLDTATQPGAVQIAATTTGGGEDAGAFQLPCERVCGGFVDYPEDIWICSEPCECPSSSYWEQMDWSGGPGQESWLDEIRFLSATNVDFSSGSLQLADDFAGELFFADDFTRPEPPPYPLGAWIYHSGSFMITEEIFSGNLLLAGSSPVGDYGFVYTDTIWTDYSVEGHVKISSLAPEESIGGGIGGRLDPATGAQYAAWIYSTDFTDESVTYVVRLIKFYDWDTWSGTPMAEATFVRSIYGNELEQIRMKFEGNNIRVYVNGELLIDVSDNGYEGIPAYLSGGANIGVGNNTAGTYEMLIDDFIVGNLNDYPYTGSLLSSAYDSGGRADWRKMSWWGDSNWSWSSGETSYRFRTRTAEQLDQLPSAPWSDWYQYRYECAIIDCYLVPPDISSENHRYIQYEAELLSRNPLRTPTLDHVFISYLEGERIWDYRTGLEVENNSPQEMQAGYSLKLVLDTQTLVNQGKLQADGRDLRIVHDYFAGMEEIDYLVTTPFNTPDTEIWFRIQEHIPAFGQSGDYYLYYGNPDAGPPPQDPAGVWALWDDFEGDALDASLWDDPSGTVIVSAGMAQLPIGASMIATRTLTNTLYETRLQLGAEDDEAGWGLAGTPVDPDNLLLFQETNAGFEARTLDDANGWPNYTSFPLFDPTPGGLAEWHTYAIDWNAGGASWLIDTTEVAASAANVSDSGMSAIFNASGAPMNVDWVKARLQVDPEPSTLLSTSQHGYVGQGTMLSIPYDTGQYSTWKYLTWEGLSPPDTDISLQVRTATTLEGLEFAPWIEYTESGELLSNQPGRWVQYMVSLSSTEFQSTPVLDRVSIYFDVFTGEFSIAPESANLEQGSSIAFTARLDDGSTTIDITGDTVFSSEAEAGGSWNDNVYTSENVGVWEVTGQYSEYTDTASLTVHPGVEPVCVTVQRGSYGTVGDSLVWELTPIASYGAAMRLSTGDRVHPRLGSGPTRSLLHFDLDILPEDASVLGATFGISAESASGETVGFYRVTEAWSEADVTWASHGEAYDASTAWGVFAVDSTGYLTTDLTTLVTAWVNSTHSNYGLMLINNGAGAYDRFRASEYFGSEPWLEVCYQVATAGEPVSIEVTPGGETVVPGESVSYQATALDAQGITWDVTAQTDWSIEAGAGGGWAANEYTSENPGTWEVTGLYDGLNDIVILNVLEHGPAVGIEIAPTETTIAAGESQAYTAVASDALGNSWDVTGETAFSIDAGAGGSWAAGLYSSQYAGDWTVSGSYDGHSDTASLQVLHGEPVALEVTPDGVTVSPGESVSYQATAMDAQSNTWDVTAQTGWSTEAGAGGGWAANEYTSENPGIWDVTGAYNGLEDYVTLIVLDHGPAVGIEIAPTETTIVAGDSQVYSATASDALGNTWDVTAQTSWSAEMGAAGDWIANEYTSANPGTWEVTGVYDGLSDIAILNVLDHGPAVGIGITPAETTIVAGESQAYTATASDVQGNTWDVTGETSWSTEAGADGGWAANEYTSENPGTWQVTGLYDGLSDIAILNVLDHGPAVGIEIAPADATIAAGESQAYTATASDALGNTWDVTGETSFSIDSGAGGSWAAGLYSSQYAGDWTVSGLYDGHSDTASLQVLTGEPVSLEITPAETTVVSGDEVTYAATAFDAQGNSWDVTTLTGWSIEAGAGGGWAAYQYTSENTGDWTVTGLYGVLPGEALLHVVGGAPTCVTIQRGSYGIVADTSIWELLPNVGYGAAARISTGDRVHPRLGSGETRSLLHFDLGFLPAGAAIQSATFGIYAETASGEPVSIYRVTEGWSETGASWGSVGEAYDPTVEWGSFSVSGSGYLTSDLSGLVAAWADGTHPNNGMMLINNDEGAYDRYSASERSGRQPWLEVWYLAASPDISETANESIDSQRLPEQAGIFGNFLVGYSATALLLQIIRRPKY